MQIRLTVTLVVSLLILGASYAFADGMLNDSATTKARGGVGNYLFWSMRDKAVTHEKNELVNRESVFENEPGYMGEELTVQQSSAIAPVQTVNFSRNSARIVADEKERLDEIASTLKADPELKARVTGFTDSEGSMTKNQALAGARARAVVKGLEDRGVSRNQLSWKAKGESDPVSENETAEGRANNRRVEIQFE